MNKFKKLVPAICMLLVSAVLMGTSTFAWFSMNTSVTATGMQIQAKSDTTYLMIGSGETDTAEEIQAATANTTTALTVSETDSKVYASAPVMDETGVGYTAVGKQNVAGTTIDGNTIKAGAAITTKAAAALATNWYTASATAPDASTIDATSARQLSSLTGYVIKKTVYLTVAVGANPANNLSVTARITAKTGAATIITPVKILVVSDNDVVTTLSSTSLTGDLYTTGKNANITSTAVHTVDIYIYYDGNDANVKTTNKANLAAVDIELTFNVASNPTAA